MAEKTDHMPDYIEMDRSATIRNWVLSQMLRGAGIAGAVLVAIMLLIYAVYLVGLLLPEESRQTPDPLLRGAIEAPTDGVDIRRV